MPALRAAAGGGAPVGLNAHRVAVRAGRDALGVRPTAASRHTIPARTSPAPLATRSAATEAASAPGSGPVVTRFGVLDPLPDQPRHAPHAPSTGRSGPQPAHVDRSAALGPPVTGPRRSAQGSPDPTPATPLSSRRPSARADPQPRIRVPRFWEN